MSTPAHDLVTASHVKGAFVYNAAGESIGHIHDLSIDKVSGQILYALVSFGGFLGIRDRYHPIPWSLLHFDVSIDGYIVPLDRAALEAAPVCTHEELKSFGDKGSHFSRTLAYYEKHPAPPIR